MTLVLAFLVTATVYAAAGFGGGSTYTALLTLFSFPISLIPIVSLLCNIIVVSQNCWHSRRYLCKDAAQFSFKLAFFSVPMAFCGGLFPISNALLLLILGINLCLSGLVLFFYHPRQMGLNQSGRTHYLYIPMLGLPLGFLAGLTGIGGGIFLAPLLYLMRLYKSTDIALISSIFILLNSLSGLVGQSVKIGISVDHTFAIPILSLVLAVSAGAFFGNYLLHYRLNTVSLRKLTGGLTFYAGIRLLFF
jgi:uncharacterized membrane protein YfcA